MPHFSISLKVYWTGYHNEITIVAIASIIYQVWLKCCEKSSFLEKCKNMIKLTSFMESIIKFVKWRRYKQSELRILLPIMPTNCSLILCPFITFATFKKTGMN